MGPDAGWDPRTPSVYHRTYIIKGEEDATTTRRIHDFDREAEPNGRAWLTVFPNVARCQSGWRAPGIKLNQVDRQDVYEMDYPRWRAVRYAPALISFAPFVTGWIFHLLSLTIQQMDLGVSKFWRGFLKNNCPTLLLSFSLLNRRLIFQETIFFL